MSPGYIRSTFIRPHVNTGYGNDHPDGVNSLPELVEFDAEHNPDHIFGLQSRVGDALPFEITFAKLQTAVENASGWLVQSGATPGRTSRDTKVPPVAILLGSDIGIFMYMAALNRIGTPVLCLSARLTPVAIAHLIKKTNPSTVLISAQVARAAKETEELLNADTETDTPAFFDAPGYLELVDGPAPSVIPPKYTEFQYGDRDSLILHSSGTTGLPKPIYHAHAYMLTYANNHNLPPQDDPFQFNVSTLPLYHGFGLLAPSLSLSIGMPFVLPPATVIPTARSTLQVLEATNAKTMFSVPSILEDILRLPKGVGIETLKALEFIVIGGAPMKESVAEELTSHGVKLLNHWGATEIGAIATVQRLPAGYDWHYLIARKDIGLVFEPAGDGKTFRLVGRAPGWEEPYVVQDLLVVNPRDSSQYRIMGRADDLIVLATGEKVRPAGLERAVSEHPSVKDVLAFGDGREAMGIIVELIGDAEPDEMCWEYLERGNALTDKHGKVTREMVIFTREGTKPFVRTDKGSLQRKANVKLFEEEIGRAYEQADGGRAVPFTGDAKLILRALVFDVWGVPEFRDGSADGVDFFEAGMDSLQATRLRRAIVAGLRATPDLPRAIEDADVESDFCFQHPTLEKLTAAVVKLLAGETSDDQASEDRRIEAMEAMVEKYRAQLFAFSRTAREIRARKRNAVPVARKGRVVLLTGSTGSLGCFLLARLLRDDAVESVICVNRARSDNSDPKERQAGLMKRRGAVVDADAWERVSFLDAELSTVEWTDPELLRVTHVIHNAWPVNFNRHIASFESHVAGLVNLLKLCVITSENYAHRTRLLFASSVAVVGRYPVLHPDGPYEIPETPLGPEYTAAFGYPEAKWVCERIVQVAEHLYGEGGMKLLRGSSVRIGQMTGSEGCGAWNETEHFPIVIRASKVLGALPRVEGSLSWMPVNRAGDVIVELAFSERFRAMYHMENPSRQSWGGVLRDFSSLMGGLPLVPFEEWMERVKVAGDETPAGKVIRFLEQDFLRMAAGRVVLGTGETKKDSRAMVLSTSLDKGHLEEYLRYWEGVL